MAKRKSQANASGSEETDELQEMIDVDFDFFDLRDKDFHALCNLLKQLLSHDAKLFDVSSLTDLLISQGIGSTVKCDGEESDAYAFCTLLNLATHASDANAAGLFQYLLEKAAKDSQTAALIAACLSAPADNLDTLAVLLNERLVNMPAQITSPFLRLLKEEMSKSPDKHFNCKYLLLLSRVFVPDGSADIEMETAPIENKKKKKAKKANAATQPDLFAYHPEDEVIEKFAVEALSFTFTNAPERDTDSFGVDTKGRLILIETSRLEEIIKQLDIEGE